MAFQRDAFQGDAFDSQTVEAQLTAGAIIKATKQWSFGLDANIAVAVTVPGSISAASVIRAAQTGSLAADAIVARVQASTATSDAVVLKTQAGSLLIGDQSNPGGAWLVVPFSLVTGSLPGDAVISRPQQGTITGSAIVRLPQQGSLSASSIVLRQMSGSGLVDAILMPRTKADAIFLKTQEAAASAGAWIYAPRQDPSGPGGPGETPLVSIIVGGVDITQYVTVSGATFTMQVNGLPGSFSFIVRDDAHELDFTSGAEITVDIDGKRKFFFPAENTTTPANVSRAWLLEGVDYNILFNKRVAWYPAEPRKKLREWPIGSRDDTVIKYVFNNYTDLGNDGVTYNGVTHIGSINPDMAGVVGSPGLMFGDLMTEINRLIGGVFYIDQFKDLNFVDVDTPNATFPLSDHPAPQPSEVGYRELLQIENGSKLANDALVWGAALGSKNLRFSRTQDTASISEHGRWQYGEFTTQMYKQASVDERASTVVYGTDQNKRGGKDDQESWTVTTFDNSYSAGQKVAISSDVFGKSDVVPIRRCTLTFETKVKPRYQLTLSHEIDLPWNTFEQKWPNQSKYNIPPIEIGICTTCGPQGGGCSGCGITDTFTRTTTDVTHTVTGYNDGGWGTSDSGLPWKMLIHQGVGGSAYVDGTTGVIHTVGDGGFYNGCSIGHEMRSTSFPTGDWDLTFDFWWGNLEGSDNRNQGMMFLDFFSSSDCSTGWIGELDFKNMNASDLNIGQGTVWFWDYANEFTWDTLWVAQTWYSCKVHYDAASQTLMARVWVEANAEPSIWHATQVLSNPAVINSIEIGYSMTWGRVGDSETDFKFDNISLPGIDRCSEYRFDNFNRTESGGWGTPTVGGAIWLNGGEYPGMSVSGGFGRMALDPAQFNNMIYNPGDGSSYATPFIDTFEMTASIRYETAFDSYNDTLNWAFIVQRMVSEFLNDANGWREFRISLSDYSYIQVRTSEGTVTAALPSLPAAGTAVNVRWGYSPTYNRAKVWWGGAEPTDWTVNATLSSGPTGGWTRFIAYGQADSANTLLFGPVDFDYDGKPCYQDCGSGPTDSFDGRTASSPSSYTPGAYDTGAWWGTSDYGSVWSVEVIPTALDINHSSSEASVAGGIGTLYCPQPPGTDAYSGYAGAELTLPLDTSFQILAKMRITEGSTSPGNEGNVYFSYYSTIGNNVTVDFGDGGLALAGEGFGTSATDMHNAGWFWMRVENDFGVESRVKVWLDGATEPTSWTITVSAVGQALSGDGVVYPYIIPGSLGTQPAALKLEIDTLTVSGATTCLDIAAEATDSSLLGRNSAVGDGTTTVFNVGAAYYPGSMKVYVNGHFYRPGYEYTESSPNGGDITFTSPPAEGADIDFFYDASGAIY